MHLRRYWKYFSGLNHSEKTSLSRNLKNQDPQVLLPGSETHLNRSNITTTKRLVIKIGTSSITHDSGKLNLMVMENLAREIADLHNRDIEVLLISSGAVGAGVGTLDYKKPVQTLPVKQALAAVGQGTLMHMYEKFFSEYGKKVAQVLLTRDVFDDRLRYLNGRNTLLSLLDLGVIPIINENDTVAVQELKFGDNDTLSSMVACIVSADLLVILSDIEGLYDSDPRTNPDARLLHEVTEITEEMESSSKTKGSALSSGGMYTKLMAARMAMSSGIPMVIAHSREKDIIRKIVDGEDKGTMFIPAGDKIQSRKHWIAFGSLSHGRIKIDRGAASALLHNGKSLLPSGITGVEGTFERGTIVSVISGRKKEIARGMVNFSSDELELIMGKQTEEIEEVLGSKDYDEVIHRDNLAII